MAAKQKSAPVFIADSCIGGLSVLRSLRGAGAAQNAVFLADYAINPLGVKSDSEVADVVHSWIAQAEAVSESLVIACNTLSIRYRQLFGSTLPPRGLAHVVSMVDCFETMAQQDTRQLAGKSVLIIGTEFTAGQTLYSEILESACPGVRVRTIAATDLEQKIARFGPWEGAADASLTTALRQAIGDCEVAVLACTCFPMVQDDLQALFPGVLFLSPGAYCAGLMPLQAKTMDTRLSVRVTGREVDPARVIEFAESYLGVSTCCT